MSEQAGTEAFEAVYERLWQPMVRLAALTTGSTAIAEEIVQEAFSGLYRHWARVETPAAWVRVAVVNQCRSWVRRRQLERRHPQPGPLVVDDPDGLAVRDALRLLTPRQRLAVVLRYYEDLSEKQIADILKCRPGTVKSLLARSNTPLKEALR